MKIIVIGATGTIGKEVVKHLSARHEVVAVGHRSGDFRVDLASAESIRALFQSIGMVDSVVTAAGQAAFKSMDEMSDADYALGLGHKLMGQVNVVRFGRASVRDGGSFTLTSGTLSTDPMPGSTSVSMVNAGLEGFVRAAALEMPRGIRINVVSPPWLQETIDAYGIKGMSGPPAAKAALAYAQSVEGTMTGKVIDLRAL